MASSPFLFIVHSVKRSICYFFINIYTNEYPTFAQILNRKELRRVLPAYTISLGVTAEVFFLYKKIEPRFSRGFFLFRWRLVGHCSLRVSHTLSGRIDHNTEDHQHGEQCIDNEQQLVAKFAQIQVVPEQRSHRLNQQQLRRDQRHPKLFVHNTYFPVNHVSHLNSKSRSFLAVRSTTEGRIRTQRRTHHSHPPFSPASVYIFHATL